jgi:hypothetical protein
MPEKVVQISEFCRICNIKDVKEAKFVFSSYIKFLKYMRVGDLIEMSGCKIHKLDQNLFYMDTKDTNYVEVLDSLEEGKVIKLL